MILLVKNNCPHCPKDLEENALDLGYQILKVIQHPDGNAYIKLPDNKFAPLPENIGGLPALVNGNHIFIGEAPIRSFLRTQA